MASIDLSSEDSQGIARLLGSDVVLSIKFIDISETAFGNPPSDYTGYASDGYWYDQGISSPEHSPFKAGWASEAEHEAATDYRGLIDRFPDRIFVVLTDTEVVILDADDLDVWMRFVLGTSDDYLIGSSGSETELVAVDFSEGALFIATNEVKDGHTVMKLYLADFRTNLGSRWAPGGRNTPATVGIEDRNADGSTGPDSSFWALPGATTSPGVLTGPVLDIAAGYYAGTTLVAVGTPSGFSGVSISYNSEGVASYNVEDNIFYDERIPDLWEISDGVFTAPTVSDWSAEEGGIKVGDVVTVNLAGYWDEAYTVTDVSGDELTIDVAGGAHAEGDHSGTGYVLGRPVARCSMSSDGALYIAVGHKSVARLTTVDWWDTASDGINGFSVTQNVTSLTCTEITHIEPTLGDIYISTDVGVFVATQDVLTTESSCEFRYSAEDGGGKYKILGGGNYCTVSAIDPETGHLLVATWAESGSTAVLTEIGQSLSPATGTVLHQAFQFFDADSTPAVPGRVNALTAYRNTSGPPDVEVD